MDLLFGEDGPLLCEVNSNSHLLNIYHCTGINIADTMFDYILKRTFERMKKIGWLIYNREDAEKNKAYIDWMLEEAKQT